MHEVNQISHPISSHSVSHTYPLSALQPLLTTLGWKDINPAIQMAEQADHALAQALQQAYEHYDAYPNTATKDILESAIDTVVEKLNDEQATAKQLQAAANTRLESQPKSDSSGYVMRLGGWLKQNLQWMFDSDEASLVERYTVMRQKYAKAIEDLTQLKQALSVTDSKTANPPDAHSQKTATPRETTATWVPTSVVDVQETRPKRKLQQTSSQTLRVVNPIPDQVFNVNEISDFKISAQKVFSNVETIFITGNFPSWMDTNCYPRVNYDTPGTAHQVVIEGTTAYIADGTAGLQIVDITNPKNPSLLGSYNDIPNPEATGMTNLAISGTLAYVVGEGTLQILNVTDSAPFWVGGYQSSNNAISHVAINSSNHMAYLIDGSYLHPLNVSNPSAPILVGNDRSIPGGSGSAIAMGHGVVSVAAGNTLLSYNNVISSAGGPILLGSYATSATCPTTSCNCPSYSCYPYSYSCSCTCSLVCSLSTNYEGVAVVETIAYVTETLTKTLTTTLTPTGTFSSNPTSPAPSKTSTSSLLILNVAHSASPASLGSYSAPYSGESFYGVAVVGTTAYVAASDGLQILDVSSSANPKPHSSYAPLPGELFYGKSFYGVAVSGERAYVTAPAGGLLILDVSNSAHPKHLYSYAATSGESFYGVAVTGITAYVATSVGLHVFNVNHPTEPVRLGNYAGYYNAGVAVVGTTAYVAAGGLQILNVANSASPVSLGSYAGSFSGIAVVGKTAYVAASGGLQILNVANIVYSLPSSYTSTVSILDISTGDGVTAIVGTNTLQIVNTTDPTHPTLLSNYPLTGISAQSVTLINQMAYVAGNSGLQVIDITDMTQPVLIGTSALPSPAYDITVAGSTAYIADGTAGLQILDLSQIQLRGLPSLLNVGDQYTFTVTGIDRFGQSVSDTFQATVAQFPTLGRPIAPPNMLSANKPFSFTIPQTTFVDPNNNPLVYSASLSDQSPLPDWLVFTPDNLTFSGTTIDVSNFNIFSIQVTATNPLGTYVSTTFQLIVQPNVPPTLANQISSQFTTVGANFKFVIPDDTFITTDGDTLIYSVQLSNGMPLPNWLHFNQVTFSGTPGMGDTNFYAIRILPIVLTARDGKFSVSTTFNINVGGTSSGELFVKITSPVVTVISVALGLYKKRALFLNRCNQKKYQRLEDTAVIGEIYSRRLNTPAGEIAKVQAKLPKPVSRSFCVGFFENPRTHIPGGALLPPWLFYDPDTNALRSLRCPENSNIGSLIIQVKDHAGVIREQFTVKVEGSVLDQNKDKHSVSARSKFRGKNIKKSDKPIELLDIEKDSEAGYSRLPG